MEVDNSRSCEPSTSKDARHLDELDDDVDLSEINKLEEILSNAGSQIQMLEFERQMFLDCVYNDALVICAK
jgi:hypothetical protein